LALATVSWLDGVLSACLSTVPVPPREAFRALTALTVSWWRHTGEGHADGVECSANLLCLAGLGGGYCVELVELPALDVERV